MHERIITCLASSRKPGGTCIAGKITSGENAGKWVRPISERRDHEINNMDRLCTNNTLASSLHIISIPILQNAPQCHQVENEIIVPNKRWSYLGRANWDQVLNLTDDYDQRFWSYSESTYHGHNDKIPLEKAVQIGASLKLIQVNELTLSFCIEKGYQGNPDKLKVRGKFTYNNIRYSLSVTDPNIEQHLNHNHLGDIKTNKPANLCISLSEPFGEYSYRLIASVITESFCETGNHQINMEKK